MKHLFYCTFLICILVAACKNEKKDANVNTIFVAQDTASLKQKKDKEDFVRRPDVYYGEDVAVDTLIEKFLISYIVKNNSSIIHSKIIYKDGNTVITKYADRSVFLTMKYNNKPIVSNRELDKYAFSSYVPSDLIDDFEIASFIIVKVTNSKVIFSVNICKPDSDNCYPVELTIDHNGGMEMREEEVHMESDSE